MGNYREPQSANEAALQNILGEQNELREPQSVTEFYLKEILEKGGGGGGGAGFPVVEVDPFYIKDGTAYEFCSVTFTDIDYIGNADTSSPFYIKFSQDKTGHIGTDFANTILCVPELARDHDATGFYAFARATIIRNGFTGVVYPKATENNPLRYVFYADFNRVTYSNPYNLKLAIQNDSFPPNKTPYLYSTSTYSKGAIAVAAGSSNRIEFLSFETLWRDSGITVEAVELADGNDLLTMMSTAISAVKTAAAASPSTTISRFVPLDSEIGGFLGILLSNWQRKIDNEKKSIYVIMGDVIAPLENISAPEDGQQNDYFATAQLKECDLANNKLYETKITLNAQKVYFQCTCHEATSLM